MTHTILDVLIGHPSTRPAAAPSERFATHRVYKWLRFGARNEVPQDLLAARMISEAQCAETFHRSYTDRAVGVSVQVMQAAKEFHEAVVTGNKSAAIVAKKDLMRRLQTIEILQAQGRWFS